MPRDKPRSSSAPNGACARRPALKDSLRALDGVITAELVFG
jgi:hypothetical protein